MLLLCPLAAAHVPFDRGDTTITELHVGAATDGGQWFEVRNDTAASQNLVEQVFTDADGDTFQVALTLIVRAGEHVVFASEDSTHDADYRFPAAFDLRADAGAVHHTDLRGTVDEVAWDATWGVAGVWQADIGIVANEWANDLPGNWCAGAGSPGADNAACPGTDDDADGDGFTEVDGDCHDGDAGVHPDAHDGPAVPDDADCDGVRDDAPAEDTGGDSGGGDSGDDTGSDDTGHDSGDTGPDTDVSGDTGTTDTGPDTGAPVDTATAETGDRDTADDGSGAADPGCGCGGGDVAGLLGVWAALGAWGRRRA